MGSRRRKLSRFRILTVIILASLGYYCWRAPSGLPSRTSPSGSDSVGSVDAGRLVNRDASSRQSAPRVAASSSSSRANSAHDTTSGRHKSPHLELGVPTDGDSSNDYLMVKPQYALSYNRVRNVANWVSWNLNKSHFGTAARRKGKFIPDTELPDGYYRVRHEDYTQSGYDRGHMVRSEERTSCDEDNRSTFLLVNVLPQHHDLNAGPWLRLEEYCQRASQTDNKELYIIAGGIFGPGKDQTIGSGVAVPNRFFKIVVVLDRGMGRDQVGDNTRVIAVVMPNQADIADTDWSPYRASVDSVEASTGYDFLSDVPEHIQRALEAKVDHGPSH